MTPELSDSSRYWSPQFTYMYMYIDIVDDILQCKPSRKVTVRT